MASEVLNIIVDSANMGNLSRNSQAIRDYMALGMSYEEASKQVLYDNIGQVVEAGAQGMLSGGISGGVSGGVALGASYASRRSALGRLGTWLQADSLSMEDMRAFVDTGLESAADTRSYKLAVKLQKKLDRGYRLSKTELAELYQANGEAIRQEELAQKEASTEEQSTAVNDNPATHTQEEMRTIEEYKNAVDQRLVQFIEESREGGKANDIFSLEPATDKAVSDIRTLTGVDVTGFKTVIERRQIWHILKRHGQNGKANQSMSDDNDIARIQYVLNNYDSVKYGGTSSSYTTVKENGKQAQAKVVVFSKKIDGTYFVAEAVPDTKRKTLFVTSAYIEQAKQKETGTAQLVNAQKSPVETPEASSASVPVIDNIAQPEQSVKGEDSAVSAMAENDRQVTGKLTDMEALPAPAEDAVSDGSSSDLVSVSKKYGRHAKAMAATYIAGQSVTSYDRAFRLVYDMGRSGVNFSYVNKSTGAADLTESQRQIAYEIGKAAAEEQKQGQIQFEKSVNRDSLSEIQTASVAALEKLAEATGLTFRLYQSKLDADGKPIGENGWYDHKTGIVHLDINAGEFGEGTLLYTTAHELIHFIRQWSFERFRVLGDFLVAKYGETGIPVHELVRRQQEKAKRNGRTIDYATAYEEMVADSMEIMLSDGAVIERIVELRGKDRRLVEKIRDWLKSFAAKLREIYSKMEPDTVEGRLVQEMAQEVDHLKELFAEAVADAANQYEAAGGQKNTTDGGGELHSERTRTADKRRWAEQHEWLIYGAIQDAMTHADMGEDNLIKIGDMPPHISEISGITGEFYVYRDHLYENIVDEKRAARDKRKTIRHGSKIHFHRLGEERVKNALLSLNKPLFSVAETGRDGNPQIGLILPVNDETGNPLYAAFGLYENKPINGSHLRKPHVVLTISPRPFHALQGEDRGRTTEKVIQNAIRDGRLLDVDIKNRDDYAVTAQTINLGSVSQTSLEKNIARFKEEVKSFREKRKIDYSERGNYSTRTVLSGLDLSAAETDVERNHLQKYQEDSARQMEQRKILSQQEAQLETLQEAEAPDFSRIRILQAEITKTQNRITLIDDRLRREESGVYLKNLIRRETKGVLLRAVEEYGAIPAGMNAAEDRAVQIPKSIDGNSKVSRVARSAAEANMTPKEFVPEIEQATMDGRAGR